MRNVPSLSVEQIAQESRRLVDMARDGRLSVDEMTGGSFTVTNLGMFEVSSFNAIINPPQVAILAVGAVERRVVPIDDQGAIGVRPMMTLNLAADHRAIDGAMGARFLQHLRDTLQSPALLA
jgi:pyruvate dehydrogenase E2 component (dihydrolipoamide acetyltransferase)